MEDEEATAVAVDDTLSSNNNELDIDQLETNDDVEIVSPEIDSRQSAAAIEGNAQVQISPQSKLTALPGSQAQVSKNNLITHKYPSNRD